MILASQHAGKHGGMLPVNGEALHQPSDFNYLYRCPYSANIRPYKVETSRFRPLFYGQVTSRGQEKLQPVACGTRGDVKIY